MGAFKLCKWQHTYFLSFGNKSRRHLADNCLIKQRNPFELLRHIRLWCSRTYPTQSFLSIQRSDAFLISRHSLFRNRPPPPPREHSMLVNILVLYFCVENLIGLNPPVPWAAAASAAPMDLPFGRERVVCRQCFDVLVRTLFMFEKSPKSIFISLTNISPSVWKHNTVTVELNTKQFFWDSEI